MADEKADERAIDHANEIAEMNARHISIALRMQALACVALEEWEAKVARGEPLNMGAEDAKMLLNVGSEMERAATGGKKPEDGDPTIPWPKKPH